MIAINKRDATLDGSKLIIEASTAGLAPGEWPSIIVVLDDNGDAKIYGPVTRPLQDGGRVYYAPRSQTELHVLND
ncbi:MAG: hypothetical protein WC683_04095 [bacterium]